MLRVYTYNKLCTKEMLNKDASDKKRKCYDDIAFTQICQVFFWIFHYIRTLQTISSDY